MYKSASNDDEKEAVISHMERFQVCNKEYKGYYSILKAYEEETEEPEPMDWNDFVNDYDIYKKGGKIHFKKRRQS